jgi:hypothetical protein
MYSFVACTSICPFSGLAAGIFSSGGLVDSNEVYDDLVEWGTAESSQTYGSAEPLRRKAGMTLMKSAV